MVRKIANYLFLLVHLFFNLLFALRSDDVVFLGKLFSHLLNFIFKGLFVLLVLSAQRYTLVSVLLSKLI